MKPRAQNNRRLYRAVCPVCNAAVETHDLSAHPYFPFCSRRCKLVDLGDWFDGEHRISEPLEESDE